MGPVPVAWLGIGATLLWIVFTTNAMNFIDGLNGLASGVALIACLFIVFDCRAARGLVRLCGGGAAGGWDRGVFAVQLPVRAHLHGRCGQPVLRVCSGGACCGCQPVRRGGTVVPAGADAVVGGVVRRGVHACAAGAAAGGGYQPHRGHLYQVAQRSGVSAVRVTLVHWGFAVFGGGCCLVFVAAPSVWKPPVPFLTVLPQVVWVWFVVRRAREAGLRRWG